MDLKYLEVFLQIVVFLLAISVHESAHAWTANRYGDPTARMLGRVSLNPIRHIDLFGTIILPAIAIITHLPVIGWAKPTPVDPRNFKDPVKADIMTSIAGPASNFILTAIGFGLFAGVLSVSAEARTVLRSLAAGEAGAVADPSFMVPITVFLFYLIVINVLLGIFNLVPLPPLDGSHVVRHLMPEEARRAYDTVGMIALFALVFLGGKYLWMLIAPVLGILFGILLRIHG